MSQLPQLTIQNTRNMTLSGNHTARFATHQTPSGLQYHLETITVIIVTKSTSLPEQWGPKTSRWSGEERSLSPTCQRRVRKASVQKRCSPEQKQWYSQKGCSSTGCWSQNRMRGDVPCGLQMWSVSCQGQCTAAHCQVHLSLSPSFYVLAHSQQPAAPWLGITHSKKDDQRSVCQYGRRHKYKRGKPFLQAEFFSIDSVLKYTHASIYLTPTNTNQDAVHTYPLSSLLFSNGAGEGDSSHFPQSEKRMMTG